MRTIKIILASIFYLGTLNLFGQATEFNKQTKKYESLSESIKSFFIGGNISSAYSEDFGPQGNVGSINTTFGTFDINDPSTTSTFSFIFNPYVGIIKTDKVSVGISALFSLDRDVFEDGRTFGTSTNSEPFTESELAFGLGLFYRRDLFTKDRFTLFTQYASQYTREQNRVITESGTNDSSTTNDKINLSVELGGKFAVNQNWNLIASILSTNFTAMLSVNKEFDFKTYGNSLQFGSFLSNIGFGIERSF